MQHTIGATGCPAAELLGCTAAINDRAANGLRAILMLTKTLLRCSAKTNFCLIFSKDKFWRS
eukprot:3094954-Amphidinium_carterae.1